MQDGGSIVFKYGLTAATNGTMLPAQIN